MKNKYITPIILAFIFITGMSACQKNLEVSPTGIPEKQLANGKEEISIGMLINSDEVLIGEEIYFEPIIFDNGTPVNCGTLSLQKFNAKRSKWEPVSGAQNINVVGAYYSIPQAAFSDTGNYRWQYISSARCNFKSTYSGSLYVTVVEQYTEY